MIETNENYWDCECEEDYIHEKAKKKYEVYMRNEQTIAFQGVPGAYSHLSCQAFCPDWKAVAYKSFSGMLRAVQSGECSSAMVPVENSTAGRVADIHHMLPNSGLHIIAEHFQPVNHQLLGIRGSKLSDIKEATDLGKKAAEQTIRKLSPNKIGSEKISIIFDKRISKGMLSAFASAISASAISRGTSFLKDKIDQQVFANSINVIDKPDIIKGMGSQNFDSEGVNSNTLQLIENGILKNYLVDTYNGKKLNLKSNGRSGGTTNLYFENGNISYEDLMKKNSRCLYITETIGHGSNLVTGDYSVGATGFLVENGEFKYPVNEITIAGNFKDMFKNIILANDLEFEYSVNSPTMMIEGMTVAGK